MHYSDILTHDIALVEVQSRNDTGGMIQFNEYVQPICLPLPQTQYAVGMQGVVSGWGTLGTGRQ